MSTNITEDVLEDELEDEIEDEIDDDLEDEVDAEAELASAGAVALRDAVLVVLRELARKELVDIEEESFDLVADELTLAAHEGRDPRHALKKMRAALIDSDNVEEVYADDRALETAFRRALEA